MNAISNPMLSLGGGGGMDSLSYLLAGLGGAVLAIIALVALLQCFFGFKLMRLWFAICGLFLGALAGAAIFFLLDMGQPGIGAFMALVGAILGAILLYRVYLIGVFLSNGTLAFLVFLLMLGTEQWAIGISLVCAIIVGVAAVKFVRVWVILCTSLAGGILAGRCVILMLEIHNTGLALLLGGVIAVLGFLFQWKTTAKLKPAPVATPAPVAAAPVQEDTAAELISSPTASAPTLAERTEKVKETSAALFQKFKKVDKRVFIGIGAAVLALVILAAGINYSKDWSASHPKCGFKAANGQDILMAALWPEGFDTVFGLGDPDAPQPAYINPRTIRDYRVGETTAAAIVETMDGDRCLVNRDNTLVSSYNDHLSYAGLVNGEPWFLYRDEDWYHCGFMDANGDIMIDLMEQGMPNNYHIDATFSEGLCALQFTNRDGWTILDTEGRRVGSTKENYEIVHPFQDGYAIVKMILGSGDDWGALDTEGNEVLPCRYSSANAARRALGLPEEESYKRPIPDSMYEHFDDVEALEGGIFLVSQWDEEAETYWDGLTNAKGEVVLEPAYTWIRPCEEPGLFQVRSAEENTIFYCDWTGQRRTPDFFFTDNELLSCDTKHVMKWEGHWAVLPQILTDKEQEKFLEQVRES